MKTKNLLFIFLISILSIQCSVEDDDPTPKDYLEINGKNYDLNYGVIEDNGTDATISYRSYQIEFRSTDSNQTPHYFSFYIKSNSTTRLEEGTYSYDYSYTQGTYSYLEIGTDIAYDQTGNAVSGTRLYENSSTTGSMKISKQNDNYLFEISGVMVEDGVEYEYTVYFNKALTEGYI